MSNARRERILFVTGKLAESSLRRVLKELQPTAQFEAEIAVLPITVAALMTTKWIASHLNRPPDIDRIVLPGLVQGDFALLPNASRGPNDLRDLPEYFGQKALPSDYGKHDIEIFAEINHAPRMSLKEVMSFAHHYRASGADWIDLGCDPGSTWLGVEDTVRALIDEGFRVSIDSFDTHEVEQALRAGAEMVLSVNSTNLSQVPHWREQSSHFEVIAIPDTPDDHASLERTIQQLQEWSVPFRIDPILEPIGLGFAASLGRAIEIRRKYPDSELFLGIGNVTELTDVDSAGINVVLAGFCQELGIRGVLTTEVINWSRSSVRELALARRLVFHAVRNKTVPKRLEPDLVMLRDPKLQIHGEDALRELAEKVTDRNYRIFAERGKLHILNGSTYLRGTDPFELFARLMKEDDRLDVSHAFYLGYEFAKAVTALTLGKNYEQDRALRWGFLTVPEVSHRNSRL